MYSGMASTIVGGAGFLPLPWVVKLSLFLSSAGCFAWGVSASIKYADQLIKPAARMGKSLGSRPTFSVKNKPVYQDELSLHTFIDEHVLLHDSGRVSLAFSWDGIDDSSLDTGKLDEVYRQRRAALNNLKSFEEGYADIEIEHHFLRVQDAHIIDEYLAHHNEVDTRYNTPPIVRDIKQQIAATLRPLARHNRVVTVVSLNKRSPLTLRNVFRWMGQRLDKRAKSTADDLYTLYENIKDNYPGFALLSRDFYIKFFQKVCQPYATTDAVDWRYVLSQQLLYEKPVASKAMLELDGVYYKVVLLQNYPDLGYKWTNLFSSAPCDVHVCQYIKPLDTYTVMDRSAVQDKEEAISGSGVRGTYQLNAKLRDSKAFKSYVANTDNSIHANFYVITYFGTESAVVEKFANQLIREIGNTGGKARADIDIQQAMWLYRLPGQCSSSPFVRGEDHADTLARMLPATVYKTGTTHRECLRMAKSGTPVTFAPSQLSLPNDATTGQMGAGKDGLMGTVIIETYHAIKYDIVELGNSYQPLIEAIGGRYCTAREQIINPLSPYAEYSQAKTQNTASGHDLTRDFIIVNSSVVQPIFKGMEGEEYSAEEELIINRAVRCLYDNHTSSRAAPILPDLQSSLESLSLDGDDREYESVRSALCKTLRTFLKTETGCAFTEQDQFTISPVANAIDFDKFEGKLFNYFLMFVCTRLVTNAMSNGARHQLILNEYGTLMERAPDVIRWVTLTLDRMGRKDFTGLSRITQELDDIRKIGTGSLNAIPNKVLLSRMGDHDEIGSLLKVPAPLIEKWKMFLSPEVMDGKGYREGIVCHREEWYELYLKFPQLLLDLMNTRGADKELRMIVCNREKDPYKRIELFKRLKQTSQRKSA